MVKIDWLIQGGLSGDRKCFEQFNSQGSINGHCGLDNNNNYIRCEPEYLIILKEKQDNSSSLFDCYVITI